MARQVRIEFPGAVHHCMARGDRRERIARDDRDRDIFAGWLGESVERTGFEIFAWVLMDKVKKRGWRKRVIGRLIRKGIVMPVG